MSTQFITNQEKLLSDVVNKILPDSKNVYFLVGYFYFSGFFELYEKLQDKQVKILIGLEIEKALNNTLKEVYLVDQNIQQSNKAIRENYYKSIKDLINKTDFCDTEEKENAFRIFLEKLKDGSLEVRKTKEHNHAKLYIFENKDSHNQGGEFPGSVITGSSNLSLSGLKGRHEINVLSRDSNNYNDAKKLFDELWQTSTVLIDKNNLDDFMEEVIEKVWIDKLPKPYLIYVRVLKEYLEVQKQDEIKLPSEITKNQYIDLKYQTDAIHKAINILSRHDGVIVADVVGLGKSIIASVIAHNISLPTIIICPPHLKQQWNDYRRTFNFNAEVYTSGSVDKALRDYDNQDYQKLIIVDESHKYRNEMTKDYTYLHQLCQGNKVVLLSATPFNNKPQDIFSMIKLFQIPAKSTIRTVDNLAYRFNDLIKEYKDIKDSDEPKAKTEVERVAENIRTLLEPFVIRRSRLDLDYIKKYKKDLQGQGIEFSRVEPPKLLEYELGNLEGKYIDTLERIIGEEGKENGFEGVRYKPTEYLKNKEKYKKEISQIFGDENLFRQSQKNLAKFMKRLLVRRFESSIYAFQSTLQNMVSSMELVEKWYDKVGKVPIYKKGDIPDVDSLQESAGDDVDDELNSLNKEIESLKESKGIWFIDKKELKKAFIEGLKKDIKLLKDIQKDWGFSGKKDFHVIEKDPKVNYLSKQLEKELKQNKDKKIVVFTEYSDTADYLYEKLKDNFRVFRYSSKYASQENKQTIIDNFDAGISKSDQKDDYDVLVATDAISEGYNLHRAGIIINYDIPYNPTRVIQRVGRINRINKKVFDVLYIYNFFPSLTGEVEVKVKRITTLKIDMINALLGSDTRVLTPEEDIETFYKKEYEKSKSEDEKLSWDVEYKNELDAISDEIKNKSLEIPLRTKIKRTKKKDKSGVLVFAKKSDDYIFKLSDKIEESIVLSPQESLQLLKAEINEKPEKTSKKFEPIYQNLKNNLFKRVEERAKDSGLRDAIDKIQLLLKENPKEKDYLEDLLMVAKDLDSLIDSNAKYLRSIDTGKNKKDIFADLKERIPHNYLRDMIEKANKIEEGEETLIIAEELL